MPDPYREPIKDKETRSDSQNLSEKPPSIDLEDFKKKSETLQKREEELRQKEKEIREKEKQLKKKETSAKVPSAQMPTDEETEKEIQEVSGEPTEKRVELLLDLAKKKGVAHAVEVAKKLDDARTMDLFHDYIQNHFAELKEELELKEL